MRQSPRTAALKVGLSSNVLDPRFGGARLDGIGTYTLALEKALGNLGVTTVRVGARGRRGFSLFGPSRCDVLFPVPLAWATAATAMTGVPAPFSGIVERAINVFHATDYLVPKLRRTPVIATLYDAIPFRNPQWVSQRLRWLKNFTLRAASRNADLVIAISNAATDELVEHYRISRDRIRVVPLGVDEEWFTPPQVSDAGALRSHGVRDGYFLFVGTLQPRKNLSLLLAAYDRLPAALRHEHQLVIAGQYGWASEDLRSDLLARAEGNEVVWLDYVPHQLLRQLFGQAHAFVFPTLAEGFGLPVLEAMASGTQVIASDLPVLREVAKETATFVDPHDVDAWSDAMSGSITRPPSATDAEAARSRARTFDWTSTARGTLDVYKEALIAR